MHFSTASLEANRKGRLSAEQAQQFVGRCVQPLFAGLLFAALPLILWSTGFREHGLMAAVGSFVDQFTHVKDLIETKGRIGAGMVIGSTLACFGMAIYSLSRISLALCFDLMDRKVTVKESRVTAREDQVLRENGRDPIEKYYFVVRMDSYPVNLAAYRALESGSVYLVYVMPRSGTLVSVEPKTAAHDNPAEVVSAGSLSTSVPS